MTATMSYRNPQRGLVLVPPSSAFALVREALLTYGSHQPKAPPPSIRAESLQTEVAIHVVVGELSYKQTRFILSGELITESITHADPDLEDVIFWTVHHDQGGGPKYLCCQPSVEIVDHLLTAAMSGRAPTRYSRLPEMDKRVVRGDGADLDAWYDHATCTLMHIAAYTCP